MIVKAIQELACPDLLPGPVVDFDFDGPGRHGLLPCYFLDFGRLNAGLGGLPWLQRDTKLRAMSRDGGEDTAAASLTGSRHGDAKGSAACEVAVGLPVT